MTSTIGKEVKSCSVFQLARFGTRKSIKKRCFSGRLPKMQTRVRISRESPVAWLLGCDRPMLGQIERSVAG